MVVFYIYELDDSSIGITTQKAEKLKQLNSLDFSLGFAHLYFDYIFKSDPTKKDDMSIYKTTEPIRLEIIRQEKLWLGLIDDIVDVVAYYINNVDKTKRDELIKKYLNNFNTWRLDVIGGGTLSYINSDRILGFIHKYLEYMYGETASPIVFEDTLKRECKQIKEALAFIGISDLEICSKYICKYILRYYNLILDSDLILDGTLKKCIKCVCKKVSCNIFDDGEEDSKSCAAPRINKLSSILNDSHIEPNNSVPSMPIPPTIPPVSIPSMPIPPVSVPPVSIPSMPIPSMPIPPVSVPPVSVPPVSIPSMPIPPVSVPPVSVPPVSIPSMPIPSMPVPPVSVPHVPITTPIGNVNMFSPTYRMPTMNVFSSVYSIPYGLITNSIQSIPFIPPIPPVPLPTPFQ